MRDSFKWHFPAQFLRWAYVIRHNDLHMFGYTISEMIPSPPDDVRGANVDPPESECRSLLCYPIRKERYQIAELSAPFPAQSCRLSAVLFLSASSLLPTLLYFPHVPLFHLHTEQNFFWKDRSSSSKRSRKWINAYVLEPPHTNTEQLNSFGIHV